MVSVDAISISKKINLNYCNDLEGISLWEELAYYNKFNHSTVIFRKVAFKDAGGYDPNCDGFEDWHLWARMVTKENAFIFNTITVFYRLNPNKKEKEISNLGLRFRYRLARSRGLRLSDVIGGVE